MVSSVIFCLMLFVSLSYGTEYSETVALHNRYKAHWKFDNETAMFYFKVEVKATGWIAFGVSRLLFPPSTSLQWNRHSMEKYDIIVGGISNGTAYYKDYMTDGHVPPEADKKQDWTVTSLTEIEGTTTMEFNRKQNTSDVEGDNVIGPGRRWIVWAYHNESDVTSVPGWEEHTEKGFKEIEFITLPQEPPVVEFVQTEQPTTGANVMAASIVAKPSIPGYQRFSHEQWHKFKRPRGM